MIKNEEIANLESCLNRAADDEPIFVLRAHDPLAPIMVRMWAEHYIASKCDARGLCPPNCALKYHEALRTASLMDAWIAERTRQNKCPTCSSSKPHLHPATAFEGEVIPCKDPWHGPRNETLPCGCQPELTPEWVRIKCGCLPVAVVGEP